MTDFDDGGQVYPTADYTRSVVSAEGLPPVTTTVETSINPGMTLWEYYSGQALVGLLTQWLKWEPVDGMSKEDEALIDGSIDNGNYGRVTCKQMAATAADVADAMIAEKRRRESRD